MKQRVSEGQGGWRMEVREVKAEKMRVASRHENAVWIKLCGEGLIDQSRITCEDPSSAEPGRNSSKL